MRRGNLGSLATACSGRLLRSGCRVVVCVYKRISFHARYVVGTPHFQFHIASFHELSPEWRSGVSDDRRLFGNERVPRHGEAHKRNVHVYGICVNGSAFATYPLARLLRPAPNVTTFVMAPLRSDPPRMHTRLRIIVKNAHNVCEMVWCSTLPVHRRREDAAGCSLGTIGTRYDGKREHPCAPMPISKGAAMAAVWLGPPGINHSTATAAL